MAEVRLNTDGSVHLDANDDVVIDTECCCNRVYELCSPVSIEYTECPGGGGTTIYVEPAVPAVLSSIDPPPPVIEIGGVCYTYVQKSLVAFDTSVVDNEITDCSDPACVVASDCELCSPAHANVYTFEFSGTPYPIAGQEGIYDLTYQGTNVNGECVWSALNGGGDYWVLKYADTGNDPGVWELSLCPDALGEGNPFPCFEVFNELPSGNNACSGPCNNFTDITFAGRIATNYTPYATCPTACPTDNCVNCNNQYTVTLNLSGAYSFGNCTDFNGAHVVDRDFFGQGQCSWGEGGQFIQINCVAGVWRIITGIDALAFTFEKDAFDPSCPIGTYTQVGGTCTGTCVVS